MLNTQICYGLNSPELSEHNINNPHREKETNTLHQQKT